MSWGGPEQGRAGVRALPNVQRHAISVPLVPGSVRAVRISTAEAIASFGVNPGSALVDAALLVVSELVFNAVRHAAEGCTEAEVTVTVAAGQLVIGVGDQDPHMIDPEGGPRGGGLQTVAELASEYAGDVSVGPAAKGRGKTVLVRFQLPGAG